MRVKKQMTTIELGIHDVLTGFADETTHLHFDEFYFPTNGKQMTTVELGIPEIPKQRHCFDWTGIFFEYLEEKR